MPLATGGPGTSNQIEGHDIAYKVIGNCFASNGNDDDLMVTMMSSQIQL